MKKFFKRLNFKRLNFLRKFLASEIPLSLILRRDVFFPHAVGIVISNKVKIGKNVTIFSNVTIGGKKEGRFKGFPVIEDDVVIYAGVCIIGGINIGKGAIIGANATIIRDVPAGSVIVNEIKLRNLKEEYGKHSYRNL